MSFTIQKPRLVEEDQFDAAVGAAERLVSYVFGHRLPPSGRCVASKKELAKLANPGRDLACYVIEVCVSCSWNHLAQAFSLTSKGSN